MHEMVVHMDHARIDACIGMVCGLVHHLVVQTTTVMQHSKHMCIIAVQQ